MPLADAAWRPSLTDVAGVPGSRSLFPEGITGDSDPSADEVNRVIDMVMREVLAALEGVEPLEADTDYAKDTVSLGVMHYLLNGVLPLANSDLDSGQAAFFRLRYVEHLGVLSGDPTTTTPGGSTIYDPIVA